jgi:cytochrome c oxidase subunit IV
MEETERSLNPEQSLQIITDAIERTKDNIKAQSTCFLLWGWFIAAASFIFYFLHQFTSFRFYFLPFPILVTAGIVYTILFSRRNSIRTETYLNWFLKQLWLVLGIGFIVVVFINVLRQQPPFTYTLILAGVGTLVSGMVMRFKPLVAGGILFLSLAVCSVFVNDNLKPLLQGIAVIGGYLVPGYLLKYSKA